MEVKHLIKVYLIKPTLYIDRYYNSSKVDNIFFIAYSKRKAEETEKNLFEKGFRGIKIEELRLNNLKLAYIPHFFRNLA